jgi:hypothetical protein
MSQLKLGLFDFFSYIIPGVTHIVLMGLALDFVHMAQLQALITSLTWESSIAYIIVGYVIGFIAEGMAIRYVAVILDRVRGKLNDRVLATLRNAHPETNIRSYDFNFIYAFAELNSPQSVEKADSFFAMGSLARNLSFAFLLFGVVTFVRNLMIGNTFIWAYGVSIISILLSLYLVFQADNFRSRSHRHLLNIYYVASQVNKKDNVTNSKLRLRKKAA